MGLVIPGWCSICHLYHSTMVIPWHCAMKLKLWLAYLAPAIESHQTAFLFLFCLFFCFLVHLNLACVVGIALGWLCFRDQCWVNAKPGCWPNLNRLLPSFRLVFFFFLISLETFTWTCSDCLYFFFITVLSVENIYIPTVFPFFFLSWNILTIFSWSFPSLKSYDTSIPCLLDL